MALAAMADERMRRGEHAYGLRTFSALVATVAVGILVLGHWPHYYWSAAFGVLSTSAYMLWLLHSGARRRDALRATGKLADTAPDYGLWRRLRYPIWTARAAEAAREGHHDEATGAWRPLELYESLRAAHQAMRAEKRRPAIARAVEQVVRGDHHDPRMADIAVHTLDLDRIATELETLVDYAAWANRLAPAITVPTPPRQEPQRQEPHQPVPRTPPAGTRSTIGPSATLQRPGRRTRVVIQRGQADAGIAVTPITAARSAGQPTAPAGRSGRTEQPLQSGPVADTITARPVPSSSGDHHDPTDSRPTTADADTRDTATDLVEAEPVTQDVPNVAPSKTAAAVAFWRDQDPKLRSAQIAARVGKSERQVRRILATLNNIEQPRRNGAPVPNLADAHR